MTDIDPLVERLNKAVHGQIFRSGVLCAEAADRIQSDAKIIEELRVALKPFADLPDHGWPNDRIGADISRARAALEPKKEG